jgi:hypothetical protein
MLPSPPDIPKKSGGGSTAELFLITTHIGGGTHNIAGHLAIDGPGSLRAASMQRPRARARILSGPDAGDRL